MLGLGLDGQGCPTTWVGEKRAPICPVETPKFPHRTHRGLSLASGEVQAFSFLKASSQGLEAAVGRDAAWWEGMQISPTFPARLPRCPLPHHALPQGWAKQN